eukprot:4274837-Amphidinium_carterae.1
MAWKCAENWHSLWLLQRLFQHLRKNGITALREGTGVCGHQRDHNHYSHSLGAYSPNISYYVLQVLVSELN